MQGAGGHLWHQRAVKGMSEKSPSSTLFQSPSMPSRSCDASCRALTRASVAGPHPLHE